VALAAELGINKVLVPAAAGVFSAFGMLMSDLRRDSFVNRLLDFVPDNLPAIQALISEVKEAMSARFEAEGMAAQYAIYGRFRYQNQEHAVEILLPDDLDIQAVSEDFHHTYEREYTYRLDAPVEFVGLHLVATAQVSKLEVEPVPKTGRSLDATRKGRRSVDYLLEGVHEADIYDGDAFEPGMAFTGPAIIEQASSTTVVNPGQHVRVDEYGNLHIILNGETA